VAIDSLVPVGNVRFGLQRCGLPVRRLNDPLVMLAFGWTCLFRWFVYVPAVNVCRWLPPLCLCRSACNQFPISR
jgi:hypothetical protein